MDNRRTSLSIIYGSADLDIQYFVGRSPITSNFIVEMDQISTGVVCVKRNASARRRHACLPRARPFTS